LLNIYREYDKAIDKIKWCKDHGINKRIPAKIGKDIFKTKHMLLNSLDELTDDEKQELIKDANLSPFEYLDDNIMLALAYGFRTNIGHSEDGRRIKSYFPDKKVYGKLDKFSTVKKINKFMIYNTLFTPVPGLYIYGISSNVPTKIISRII
jgi:hypothetical protein